MNNVDYESLDLLNKEIFSDIETIQLRWNINSTIQWLQDDQINISPVFQRKDAWTPTRKSSFIESLLLNIPIPEIILVEDPTKPYHYLVIDGKQRLSTIYDFYTYSTYDTDQQWNRKVMNSQFSEFKGRKFYELDRIYQRRFLEYSLRVCIIRFSNRYSSTEILNSMYDIFERINTGSVLLSTQELRQSLYHGPFMDHLLKLSNSHDMLHSVMAIRKADNRFNDVDILLRFICLTLYSSSFKGNLKSFLNKKTEYLNMTFNDNYDLINSTINQFNQGLSNAIKIFGNQPLRVGRKMSSQKDLNKNFRLNKPLLEAQIFALSYLSENDITEQSSTCFINTFIDTVKTNSQFYESLTSQTTLQRNTQYRFQVLCNLVEQCFNIKITTQLDFPIIGTKDNIKQEMKNWFLSYYDAPVNILPYESREGGYIPIWGEIDSAENILLNKFGNNCDQKIISDLAKELEEEYNTEEWSPTSAYSEDYSSEI